MSDSQNILLVHGAWADGSVSNPHGVTKVITDAAEGIRSALGQDQFEPITQLKAPAP